MLLTADDSTGSGAGWNVTIQSSDFVWVGTANGGTDIPASKFALTTGNYILNGPNRAWPRGFPATLWRSPEARQRASPRARDPLSAARHLREDPPR